MTPIIFIQFKTNLKIPKDFLFDLIKNTFKILASKFYLFNKKLKMLFSKTLRDKIIRYLFNNIDDKKTVRVNMNIGKFSDFLSLDYHYCL